MNFIQRIIGALFPPYKYSVIREEQGKLFNAIVSSFPDEFAENKRHLEWGKLMDLKTWVLFPEYRLILMAYSGDSLFKLQKRGNNYKISGLAVFSKKTGSWEQVELLIQDNLFRALRIGNSNYDITEFDLTKINSSNATK